MPPSTSSTTRQSSSRLKRRAGRLNAKLAEVKTAEDAVGDKTIKITTDKSQLDEAKTALQDFNTEFDKAVAAAERDSESAGKSIGNLSNDVKNLDNDGKTLGSDLNIAGTAIGDLVSVAGAASGPSEHSTRAYRG